MRLLLKIIFLSTLVTGTAFSETCPKNAPYFCISPDMAPNTQIKLSDFYQVPSRVLSLFNTQIVLDALWESPYFGAGMSLYNGQLKMTIWGGTTRVEGMTLDAYAALACHEISHVVGGAPFQTIKGAQWSSSEGQADFFAASVCLPRYFKSIGVNELDIASRVEKAGFEMLSSLSPFSSATKSEELHRFIEDKTIAEETLINNYPTLKCRYENFRNPSKRANCWYKE